MNNSFFRFKEIKSSESPLSKIAKSMENKTMDLSELDKPFLEFKGTLKDVYENKEDVKEKQEKIGGRYKDVYKEGEGELYEVHHIPADSASNIERSDGPAIKMEKPDHRETASCGNSREAREYRETQKELINEGEFREAIQMDIDDIKEKFGDKYDDAISEMLDYVDNIELEGKIYE